MAPEEILKYDPLTTPIRYNDWSVYFFAVEICARGYCSTSLKSCLLHLGLPGKLVWPILKSLSLASLKASFQIWQARDSKEWIPITMDPAINVNLKNDKQNPMSSKPIHSEKAQPPVDFAINNRSAKTYVNCGLLNKGNTCYVNASLQCLSTMEQLWSNFTFCNDSLSPFTSSFVRIMSLLRSSKSPLDPSQFLRFLQGIVTKSGKPNFSLFHQQDAAEILSCIFEEFCVESLHVQNMLRFKLRYEITCNTCFNDSSNEESSSLLQLAVSNSIQTALNSSLETEILSGDNSIYCNFCCSLKSPSMVPAFLEIGRYLVIQLKRFVSHDNQVLKYMKHVHCTPNISVPVKDNEVTFNKHCQLIATISHTGNLNRGHYTAFMKIPNSKS